MRRLGLPLVLLAVLLGVSACGNDAPDAPTRSTSSLRQSVVPDSMTIPRMLESDDRFSTLRAALDSTGLDSLLSTDGPYTLFAPPNEAFEALPPETLPALLTDRRERLRTILAQHVVEGQVAIDGHSSPQQIVTMAGDTLTLKRAGDRTSIGEATIVDQNIEASNGRLHILNQVLPPPAAEEGP